MTNTLFVLDGALFLILGMNVVYTFLFSLLSRRKVQAENTFVPSSFLRIVILVPAYREDRVIRDCVDSCLSQRYPSDRYRMVVVSDGMRPETDAGLQNLPLTLYPVAFANSTKVLALRHAVERLAEPYDVVLILDADNVVEPDFLQRVNAFFLSSPDAALQLHRVARTPDTRMAVLDAASEEINTAIFRRGHVAVGLSAALAGSGMAFRFDLFREELSSMQAVGGFDKELELNLLFRGCHIGYLDDVPVYDEKVSGRMAFARQRRRWLSAQCHYAAHYARLFPKALWHGNWNFCDKYVQMWLVPRVLLLGLIGVMVLLAWWLPGVDAVKWIGLLGLLLLAFILALPRSFYRPAFWRALAELPVAFLLMLFNLFRLCGANRRFLHTVHGRDTHSKV